MKNTTPSNMGSSPKAKNLLPLFCGLAAGAALLLFGPPAEAKTFLGFGSGLDQKYDFAGPLAELRTNVATTTIPPRVAAAVIEVTSAPDATAKNHKSGSETWPYLFLTQYAGARDAVSEVTRQVLASKGVETSQPTNDSLTVRILLDRFTGEQPQQKRGGLIPLNFKGEDRTRHAFVEGRLSVLRQGKEVYARKLAIQATRVFGKAGEALGWVSPLAKDVAGAKEDSEGNRSLMTEVLAKLREELAKDTDLFSALSRSKPSNGASAEE